MKGPDLRGEVRVDTLRGLPGWELVALAGRIGPRVNLPGLGASVEEQLLDGDLDAVVETLDYEIAEVVRRAVADCAYDEANEAAERALDELARGVQ